MGPLSAYRYVASRMALMSLAPAFAYWLVADFWVGLKMFLGIQVVMQSTFAWIFRRDLMAAFRRDRSR